MCGCWSYPSTGPASPEQLAEGVGGRTAISLTVESTAPTGRHFFDLDLRNERPGLLQVVVQVTDTETGVSRYRATPITLLAN